MKKVVVSAAICVGVAAILSMAAFVETTAQTQVQSSSQAQTQPAQKTDQPEQQVTVVGCVQRESDYRRAHGKGRAGVAGTGIGAENEYVLVDASISTGTTAGTPEAAPGTPTGTTGAEGGLRADWPE